MSGRHWNGLSLLDALRPDSDQQVTCAVLTSYSVDLVALVAALLALAGLDDDRGSGSKVDFAQTIEQLRGRVKVLAQAGRITVPKKAPKIMAVLDQFIGEVQSNEAEGSWHPKLALVRYQAFGGGQGQEGNSAVEWRLWVSSRNLTRDLSWDAGLLLIGRVVASGANLPGVLHAAEELFSRAALSAVSATEMLDEVRRLFWHSPQAVKIEDFNLLLPGRPRRGLPAQPTGVRELIVVSPFLDGNTIGTLGAWGDSSTQRSLLSTTVALQRLAGQSRRPLRGFLGRIGALDSPVDDLIDPAPDRASTDLPEVDEEEGLLEGQGLHAKLIYAKHAGGESLWLGSANATRRGWSGPNFEAVARLSVKDGSIAEGLQTLLELSRPFDPEVVGVPPEDSEEVKVLTKAHSQVAYRWQVTHRHDPGGSLLRSAMAPHPDDGRVVLETALLGADYVSWPRGANEIFVGIVPQYELSGLVGVKLLFNDVSMEWIQTVRVDPEPCIERDRHLISRHLDARTFLLWIRSLLHRSEVLDGGGEWWEENPQSATKRSGQLSLVPWAPTIEDVLKTWVRNPETLVDVDRKIRHYLEIIRGMDAAGRTPDEHAALDEFWSVWQTLSAEFLPEAEGAS